MEAVRVEPVFQIIHHLLVAQLRQRLLLTIRKYFPKGHAKGPNITLGGPESLQKENSVINVGFYRAKHY